jgi:hypothetical protein
VWTGIPTDSGGQLPLAQRTTVPPAPLRFASRGDSDQTGLHSTLCIDDIACGPAVGSNRPFAFKADYADPDTVAEVVYAIVQGPAAFDNRPEAERATTTWLPAKNGEVIEPDIAKIPDGIHHLLVRARDGQSLWSHPADLPFMLDRAQPQVAHAINAVEKYNGSSLTLSLTDPVSPPVPNTLRLSCLGSPLDIAGDNGFSTIGHGTLAYEFDWIWLLRKQLAAAKHGDVLPITVDGITDAAGNGAPPLRIDVTLDLESDKRPPTVLPVTPAKNTLWMQPTLTALAPFFPVNRNIAAATVATADGQALELAPNGEKGAMIQHAFSPAWDPDKHPWIALSFRTLGIPEGTRPFTLAFNTGPRRPRGIKDAHTLDLTSTNHLAYVVGDTSCATGVWHDILINARDFLRDETEEHKDTPDLTYLSLYFSPRTKGGKVQIRSFAILAPWTSDHLIPLKAYDLNSIKGLVWQGGEAEQTGVRPANLTLPKTDPYWFRFRISDRRGNLTDTWMIPIPPGSENTKPTLPGLEPVSY